MTKMEARRLPTKQFATFDAGKARCSLASDREHLLAVIEAGFGDFHDFRVARNLLASRLHDELYHRAPFPLEAASCHGWDYDEATTSVNRVAGLLGIRYWVFKLGIGY